ncbi:MAG: maleylacetoacetate isomerase [Rhodomicrobium sp.]
MRFYGFFRSSAVYRCRIAFGLKGLKPELVPIHLRKHEQRSSEYLSLNPQGLVPALQAGGHTLTQSLAIIEWLDETHPEPALLPSDPFARAYVRALALSIACDIHPLQNTRVLQYLRKELSQDQDGLDRWCRHWIESGLQAFDAIVASSGYAGTFCCGDQPSLADICLIPQLFAAQRFQANVAGLQQLQRIRAACEALPAFAEAHPARQPDAEA